MIDDDDVRDAVELINEAHGRTVDARGLLRAATIVTSKDDDGELAWGFMWQPTELRGRPAWIAKLRISESLSHQVVAYENGDWFVGAGTDRFAQGGASTLDLAMQRAALVYKVFMTPLSEVQP